MKAVSLVAASIATTALAQRVVPMTFSKAPTKKNTLSRRASTYTEILHNNLTAGGYYAEVSLGTPAQQVTLVLDTGSSDVWVLDKTADLCNNPRLQVQYGDCLSTYDPADSSTYKLIKAGDFQIQYADSTGAAGDFISDTFQIGGAIITGLQVGLAENSTVNSGIIGIGFDTNESVDPPYPNLIDLLASQDLIASKAYSLYLDDLTDPSGTILFGGIDTGKYTGELKQLNILPSQTQSGQSIYAVFGVALTSVTINGASSASSASDEYLTEPIGVVLDSGTTLTYLPSDTANDIFHTVGAYDDSLNTGLVYVSCNYAIQNPDVTFDFQFGNNDGPLIQVPAHELVLDNIKEYIAEGLQLPRGLPFSAADTCSLGLQGNDQLYLLGDTFLRSAYVVYDLDSKKIAMAQADLESTSSNIVEIGSSGIPLLTGGASSSQTATPTSTPTATPTPGSTMDEGTSTQGESSSPTTNAMTTSSTTSVKTSTALGSLSPITTPTETASSSGQGASSLSITVVKTSSTTAAAGTSSANTSTATDLSPTSTSAAPTSSSPGSTATHSTPAPAWGAISVTLLAILCGITGATLFAF